MDTAFIKWVFEAYGPWAALAYVFWTFAPKNKQSNTDVAAQLIIKIDAIDVKLNDMRERVAKIEGKMDAE